MSENRIEDLVVYASGIHPVEISKGKQINATKRVKLKASVDRETLEVSFYIAREDIEKLEK